MSEETQNLAKRMFLFLEDGDWAKADEYAERILDIDADDQYGYLGKLLSELQVSSMDELRNLEEPIAALCPKNYDKVMRFGDEKTKELLWEIDVSICYNYAVKKMASCTTVGNWQKAADILECATGYMDADEKRSYCLNMVKYLTAKMDEASDNRKRTIIALKAFEELGDFKKSKLHVDKCRKLLKANQFTNNDERVPNNTESANSSNSSNGCLIAVLGGIFLFIFFVIISSCARSRY